MENDCIKIANNIVKDIFDELKENLIGVDLSKINLDEDTRYEMIIPYSAIDLNRQAIIEHCYEVVSKHSKDIDLGDYSIEVEDDDNNEKVRIGVWG